jgi:hypothetical protein
MKIYDLRILITTLFLVSSGAVGAQVSDPLTIPDVYMLARSFDCRFEENDPPFGNPASEQGIWGKIEVFDVGALFSTKMPPSAEAAYFGIRDGIRAKYYRGDTILGFEVRGKTLFFWRKQGFSAACKKRIEEMFPATQGEH